MTSRAAGLSQAGMGAAIPGGDSRVRQAYEDAGNTGAAGGVNLAGRGAGIGNQTVDGSGTGPTGVAIGSAGNGDAINGPASVGGSTQWYRWVGASNRWHPLIMLHIQQPAVAFRWWLGRYVFECVASWQAAPAVGVDSGIACLVTAHTRLLPGSLMGQGLGIYNVNGTLKFVSRGTGGYEEVDLSAFAGPLNGYNKIGLHLCQPTKVTPARVIAMVNDVPACVRFWTGVHALPIPAGGMYFHTLNVETPNEFRTAQIATYMGPDIDDL